MAFSASTISGSLSGFLSTYLAPLQARWSLLPLRDRRALAGLGAFFAAMLVWFALVAPILHYADRQRVRLLAAQEDLAWMQANAAVARRAAEGTGGQLAAGQSLLAAVNASALAANLNLQRFEPEGDRRVRVTLENAVFTDVMRWLVDLERRHGVTIESFSADRQPQPGIVNIRLTLGISS